MTVPELVEQLQKHLETVEGALLRAARENKQLNERAETAEREAQAHKHLLNKADGVLTSLQAERDRLATALKEVIALSDRKHDAWDKAKAALAGTPGEGES